MAQPLAIRTLTDEGYVRKIDRGLYEITREGERKVFDEDTGTTSDSTDAEGGPSTAEQREEVAVKEANVDPSSSGGELEDMVTALDLEGHGTTLENRKRALVAIVELLREKGAADVSQLKSILEDHDHGYEDTDAAWSNLRRQEVFDNLPVETPGQGGRKYRYAG